MSCGCLTTTNTATTVTKSTSQPKKACDVDICELQCAVQRLENTVRLLNKSVSDMQAYLFNTVNKILLLLQAGNTVTTNDINEIVSFLNSGVLLGTNGVSTTLTLTNP